VVDKYANVKQIYQSAVCYSIIFKQLLRDIHF
jgi:hypothetical protein